MIPTEAKSQRSEPGFETSLSSVEPVSNIRLQPYRILYVEVNEDGTTGGSHQALYDLVRHLDRSRYEPVVLFYEDNPFAKSLQVQGFEVHSFATERKHELAIRWRGNRFAKTVDGVAAILRRWRFIRQNRIDAVHINNSPRVGTDDWLPAARLLRIPILATTRGDAEGPGDRLHRWLSRRFDCVLPVSAHLALAMIQNGIPENRLSPIRDGVDLQEIRSRVERSAVEVRRELGIEDGKILLVMVGNIREWKGQHVLLEALGELTLEERRRLHVVFIGAVNEESSAYHARLKALEHELDLTSHVRWLGPRADVPDFFAAADLAIHSSIIPEPFGLVVIESLALGTPVAAANSGGPAEIVTSTSGWLHDPANPVELANVLREISARPEVLQQRVRGAHTRAQEYSIEFTVEATVAAYQRVFSHHAT